jgi:hypothetical protein
LCHNGGPMGGVALGTADFITACNDIFITAPPHSPAKRSFSISTAVIRSTLPTSARAADQPDPVAPPFEQQVTSHQALGGGAVEGIECRWCNRSRYASSCQGRVLSAGRQAPAHPQGGGLAAVPVAVGQITTLTRGHISLLCRCEEGNNLVTRVSATWTRITDEKSRRPRTWPLPVFTLLATAN